jgi:hypothetical protein
MAQHRDLHILLVGCWTKTNQVKDSTHDHERHAAQHHRLIVPAAPSRLVTAVAQNLHPTGTHRSVRALNADIRAWIETWNDDPRPYVWTKTADQILESIKRYCTRINDSRH